MSHNFMETVNPLGSFGAEGQYTIVIVEDDPSLREGIHDLLEFEDGISVHSVCDGIEAMKLLEEVTPDLIISDIMMPNMNGYELLENVRKIPKLVRIPFIFLTARGSKDEVFEGRKSGAEMYITKPFDIVELVDLAKTQLQRSWAKKLASQENISSFKRTVLQILNHEFRTPLTYVTAYYDMLADSIDYQKGERNMGEYLNGILTGCDRLSDLIEDLILVVDVQDGKLGEVYRSSAKPVSDINRFIELALVNGKQVINKYGIEVNFHPLQPDTTLWGVEDQIEILISHLVENAIKFTASTVALGNPGRIDITLALSEDRDWLELQVVDTGIGFPKEVGDKIFEIFYQYNRQHFEQQGSGVGLPIAKGIANIHGGDLSLESVDKKGCTATLMLPIFTGQPILSKADALSDEKKKASILLVEDDAALLTSLVDLLAGPNEKFDFITRAASNGKDALELLDEFTPDIIISDLMMPELNGLELLQKVRDMHHLVHVPFIIVSAKNRDEDIFTGRKLGAEEYITKPYKAEEFLAITEVQLERFFEQKVAETQDFDHFKENILRMLQPDFLAPLGSVSENSTMLASEEASIENANDLRATLGEIQQGSSAISELVEDFMSLAEIETGEAIKAFDSKAAACYEFQNLIYESLEYHQSAFEHNQLSSAVEDNSLGYGALIDFGNMRKALTRLVGIVTSLCVSAEGKTVSIKIDGAQQDGLILSFSHDGKNLTEEEIANLQSALEDQADDDFNPMDFSSHLKIVDGFIHIHRGEFSLVSGDEMTPDKFVVSLPKLNPPTKFDSNNDFGFTLQ